MNPTNCVTCLAPCLGSMRSLKYRSSPAGRFSWSRSWRDAGAVSARPGDGGMVTANGGDTTITSESGSGPLFDSDPAAPGGTSAAVPGSRSNSRSSTTAVPQPPITYTISSWALRSIGLEAPGSNRAITWARFKLPTVGSMGTRYVPESSWNRWTGTSSSWTTWGRGSTTRDQGHRPDRAAAAAFDLEGQGHEHGAGRGELRQVRQLRHAVLVRAEHERMDGECGFERIRLASVGPHRLGSDADDRRLLGQPLRAVDGEPRGVRALLVRVQEGLLVLGPLVPAGSVQQPAALGKRSVLGFPGAHVVDGQEVVGVLRALGALVDDHGRPDHPLQRQCGDVVLVLAGDPVDRRVEVGADVLPALEPAPVPGRTGVVVVADL